jgi:hypothetical protein
MSEVEKPDLKNGVPLTSIPDGGKLLGAVDGEEVLLVRRGTELFGWVLIAPTTTGRSQRDWSLMTKCDVPGTMPVSVWAPAKPYELLRSTLFRAGGLSRQAKRFS